MRPNALKTSAVRRTAAAADARGVTRREDPGPIAGITEAVFGKERASRPGEGFSRRIFLRGAAGAALATPFLSSLNEVRGQSTATPRRLVVFYTHNGCITDKWWPALEDGPLTADTLASTTLAPLGRYYQKLLLPRGFRSMNMYAQGQTIDPHDQAMGSKLTCATINGSGDRYATAPSLDHVIAKQINPGGGAPLVLGVGAPSSSIKDVISFSAANTPFPAITNPQTVFKQLTGLAGSPETDHRVARGESIIDLVRGDLSRYQRLKMSQADQSHIQDWLDLLRDTEIGVNGSCSMVTSTELGITEETVSRASTPGPFSGGATPEEVAQSKQNLATSFTQGGDMMMNLMALSMLCDSNRVFLLTFPGYVVFDWDGIQHTHDHSGLSHRTGDSSIGGCALDHALDMLFEIDTWYANKFARMVGLFDSVSEGGGTLLDNTATLWLPELSDGMAHNLNNLPILIAGSAGGYMKQGVAVNVEGTPIGLGGSSHSCDEGATIASAGSTGGNVPINKLYVTLMNALGCTADDGGKVTEFGVFDGMNAAPGIANPGESSGLVAG